jgi:pyrroline-5-carboxylate reductase
MIRRETARLGFLGAGKMATALGRGWINTGQFPVDRVLASDPSPQAREAFARETGAGSVADNRDVVMKSDVLILAVKPQFVAQALTEVQQVLSARHLLVSIAAGVTLRQLAQLAGSNVRLVRVMPNTPSLVGECAAAYSVGDTATSEDQALVNRLFDALGRAFCVPEGLLDAVTGLSGSGPAYVYVIIEALSDGGVRMGLPRDVATVLAAQTVLGAARMVLEMGLHTGQLKDMVTSPGGTTIAGLHALERGGLRAALMDAVEAATQRATELGRLTE